MNWQREHTGLQFPDAVAWTFAMKPKTATENEGAGGARGITRLWQGQPRCIVWSKNREPPRCVPPLPEQLTGWRMEGGSPACPGAPRAALSGDTAQWFGKRHSQPRTQAH